VDTPLYRIKAVSPREKFPLVALRILPISLSPVHGEIIHDMLAAFQHLFCQGSDKASGG
jgi:hypothetical protein